MTYIYLIIIGAAWIWLGYHFAEKRKAQNMKEAREPNQLETKEQNNRRKSGKLN